jgi:hypothetical protein
MNESNQTKNEETDKNFKKNDKSLESGDKEVIEQRNPPEDSEAISDAGKRREDEKRYQ